MNRIDLIHDIKRFNDWRIIEPICKGWSDDIKFYIEDKKGERLLLRLSNIDLFEKKQIEYENLCLISKLGFKMSIPVEFGICNSGKKVYSLLTWIDGKEAIEEIPKLSKDIQYDYGLKAGQILQKIHSIKPKEIKETWEKRYKRKIDLVIKAYLDCGYKLENDDIIISFIKESEKYLKDRPITYQHGDFHLGNMLITPEGELAIIDFNRSGYGDPWEEYDRIAFSLNESIDFVNGQIHSYFDYQVQEEFFKLLSLYNARNLIASIPWSVHFGESELEVAYKNAKMVYEAYSGFTAYIPSWYNEPAVRRKECIE